MHILKKILQNRKTGRLQGVYSACTASPAVIDTVFRKAAETDTPAVIEATANQVNQFGGYTGMRPADYFRFICETAEKIDHRDFFTLLRDRSESEIHYLRPTNHLSGTTWRGSISF